MEKEISQYKWVNAFDTPEGIVLYRRDEKGNRVIKIVDDFRWYFCLTIKDFEKAKKRLDELKIKQQIQGWEIGPKYVKIYCKKGSYPKSEDPASIAIWYLTNDGFTLYEADIEPYKRFLIDNKLQIADNYHLLYFDIETGDLLPGIQPGAEQILSFAGIDENDKIIYLADQNEKKLLSKIKRVLEEYDLIIGWNSERFDIPALKERFKKHRIVFRWRSVLQVDLMKKLMEIRKRDVELHKEVRSFALDAVCKKFIGEGKMDMEGESVSKTAEENPELLKEYNIHDVLLLKKLDQKLNILKQKIVECQVEGSFLNEFAISRLLDIFTLRNADQEKYRFPSKMRDEGYINLSDKYVGGLVLEPVRGIHKNIYLFDFKSLYPSIIQTFNISPEIHLEKPILNCITTPNQQCYSSKKGIIPSIIGNLLKERDKIRYKQLPQFEEGTPEYNDLYFKQYAFKVIANSYYGLMGAPFTRYFKIERAESITLTGHYLFNFIKKIFDKRGFQVIYGDTDSIFVKIDEECDPKLIANKISELIEKDIKKKFNVKQSLIQLDFKHKYDRFIIIDKKRYAGTVNGKILVSGLEVRKRDTMEFVSRNQTKLLKHLAQDDFPIHWYKDWITKLRRAVIEGKLPLKDIVIQTRMSKEIEQFKSNPPHLRIARWLKERKETGDKINLYSQGCYIPYIIISDKPLEVKHPSQFNGMYDASYYWNRRIYPSFHRILKVVFPDENWDIFYLNSKVDPRQKALF